MWSYDRIEDFGFQGLLHHLGLFVENLLDNGRVKVAAISVIRMNAAGSSTDERR